MSSWPVRSTSDNLGFVTGVWGGGVALWEKSLPSGVWGVSEGLSESLAYAVGVLWFRELAGYVQAYHSHRDTSPQNSSARLP